MEKSDFNKPATKSSAKTAGGKSDFHVDEAATGLGTMISWHNTPETAYDGNKIFPHISDEAGHWPSIVINK